MGTKRLRMLAGGVLILLPVSVLAMDVMPMTQSKVVKLYEDEAATREAAGGVKPVFPMNAVEESGRGYRVLVGGKEYWLSKFDVKKVPKLDSDCSTADRRAAGITVAAGRAANEGCVQQPARK